LVKIKLARAGTKKRPFYHIVIADSRTKRDGKTIERIGSYNPLTNAENQLKLDSEKVLHWYRRGAQPTETVRSIIQKHGIQLTTKQ